MPLHFEHRTPELKLDQLYEEWESELLKTCEHPDVLHARLMSIQRKLNPNSEERSVDSVTQVTSPVPVPDNQVIHYCVRELGGLQRIESLPVTWVIRLSCL